MKSLQIYFLLVFTIFTQFGCQKTNKTNILIDNKSYINNFELLQERPDNQTSVKITSPKAIIDPLTNDIEIIESSIEILNKNNEGLIVKSGKSTLNNFSNFIRVFNNVNISFLKDRHYYITTNSLDWDLNRSVININNPFNINFDSSYINASNGLYNIDLSLLKIENTEFHRNIYNSDGNVEYKVDIKSDFAKWFKNDNKLIFTSNNKQVETTINVLLTE